MGAHRYWRLFITHNNGNIARINLAELQFREIAGVNQQPSGGTAIRSSAGIIGVSAPNAFDGNNATRWEAVTNAYEWIGYDYGPGNSIEPVEILLGAPTSSSYLNLMPRIFALEYSDDGVTWHHYYSFEEQTGWTVSENRVFGIDLNAVSEYRVTQAPVHVIDIGSRELRVTQSPILVITLPVQPARVTQAPVLVPNVSRPVPLPLPFAPETPVTEVWVHNTAVTIADKGKEQRSALRGTPRVSMRFRVLTIGVHDRISLFNMLYKYQGIEFLYPFFQYGTPVSPASAGVTELYFRPEFTDVRAGEQAAIYDPYNETIKYVEIDAITPDGADLVSPLDFDIRPGSFILPTGVFRLPSLVGMNTGTIVTDASLRIETAVPRPLVDGDESWRLTYHGADVVLDRRPNAGVEDTLDRGVRWSGDETSLPRANVKWRVGLSSGPREFTFNRFTEIRYWRAFIDHCKGMTKTFLMPTYFDDLPLDRVPPLNSTVLVTSNIDADAYMRHSAYHYVKIVRDNGKVTYHTIRDKKLLYDTNSDPYALEIRLATSIGNTAGDNNIRLISFMDRCRLNDDNVTLTHFHSDSVISLSYKAVMQ